MSTLPPSGNRRIYLKAAVLFFLILILMVPTFFIDSLISERQYRREEAIQEISGKWGLGQTISGPVLSIPYHEYYRDSLKNLITIRKYIHILPEHLQINNSLNPEIRYRSIYEVAVYQSEIGLRGKFDLGSIATLGIPPTQLLWNEAFVALGISDLRGIEEQVNMSWNGKNCTFNSGIETQDVLASAIHSRVPIAANDTARGLYTFQMDLKLKGSDFLRFMPVGKITEVESRSNWKTPSFDGAFLPDRRNVTDSGFYAYWKVLHLNRQYPQIWTNSQHNLQGSEFGFNLLMPVDQYQKSERTIKYAILFIGLTFLMYFFLELINNKSVHPFQYLLIGLALCLFYTLLIAISEHLNYNLAYLIASVMTIGLITIYSWSVLKAQQLAIMIGLTLSILYGFIFSIIQMEDYALLMGSIGLFLILGITMYYSRKIDWEGLGR